MNYKITYKTIKKDLKENNNYNDYNYCTVVSGAIMFQRPFKEIQEFYFSEGRKRFKGFCAEKANKKLCKKYGFTFKEYRYSSFKQGYVSRNFEDYLIHKNTRLTLTNYKKFLDYGDYIFSSHGSINHAICVKNNEVEDWTNGRRYTIESICKFEKIEKTPIERFDFSKFINI